VRSSEAVDKIIAETIREHAGLDILVNNAGISDGRANALETTDELLDMVLDVNLRGAVYATRAALRFMAERKSGRIINVASIAALRVAINGLPYTISKFGMAGLTRHTAVHFGATGVTVNAICPGFTSTDMIANSKRIVGDLGPAMNRAVGSSPDAVSRCCRSARSSFTFLAAKPP
jgi:NAD(P)-dependent dehydrogenase (short-subunit alcohol dehydrogenase family)